MSSCIIFCSTELRYYVGRIVDYRIQRHLQSEHLPDNDLRQQLVANKYLQGLAFISKAWAVEEYLLHIIVHESTSRIGQMFLQPEPM